jgi:hypothetical protein
MRGTTVSKRFFPPNWRPRRGDPAEIRLVRDVRIAEIDQGDRSWSVWIDPSLLRRGWHDAAPHAGDTIRVGYLGDQPTRDGERRYGLYSVAVVAASRPAAFGTDEAASPLRLG